MRSELNKNQQDHSAGRGGLHKQKTQSNKANRSAHYHIVLRSLSELPAQGWYMVLVHWSQQLCVEGREQLVCGILSRRHELEPSEVVSYRAFPMTTGQVGTFFTAMRLTTNVTDGSKRFGRSEGGMDHCVGDQSKMSGLGKLWSNTFTQSIHRAPFVFSSTHQSLSDVFVALLSSLYYCLRVEHNMNGSRPPFDVRNSALLSRHTCSGLSFTCRYERHSFAFVTLSSTSSSLPRVERTSVFLADAKW